MASEVKDNEAPSQPEAESESELGTATARALGTHKVTRTDSPRAKRTREVAHVHLDVYFCFFHSLTPALALSFSLPE